jgi:hypothetical protein
MNTIRAAAAIRRVRGTSSPTAPRISQMPVNVTMNAGFGTEGGTIAIMSGRMLLKWAAAVKQSITARASRVHDAHPRKGLTPAWPIRRATSATTTRTISGAMAGSQSAPAAHLTARRPAEKRKGRTLRRRPFLQYRALPEQIGLCDRGAALDGGPTTVTRRVRLRASRPLPPARRSTPSRDRARARRPTAAPPAAAAAARPPESSRAGSTRSRCRPGSAGPS